MRYEGDYIEAVPVAEHQGYTLWSQLNSRWDDNITLLITDPQGGQVYGAEVTISPPEVDPDSFGFRHRQPESSSISGQSVRNLVTPAALLLSEAWLVAAQLASVLDEAYGSALERAKKQAEKARQQARRERAVDTIRARKRREAIKEEVQWLIGQSGRLTRYHYRSTVQIRPIIRITDYGFDITTERGDYMNIGWSELKTLDIKYEGERAFTPISIPEAESFEVTEEEIEAFVKKS